MLTKDQAIWIRTVDYSETSQIVTFFTKATGKIDAIAKGSKRPKSAFGGPIEMLSHGRVVFSDSKKQTLATLTEFESVADGPTTALLRKDLFGLNCCLFAAELLNHLTHEYDPHPALFDSFLQFLQDTADTGNRPQTLALLILFQLTLLREVGLQPILNQCVNCKTRYERRATRNEFYFSSSANGLICRDCEPAFQDKIQLGKNAAACLTDLKLIAKASGNTLNEIEAVLISHFTELLGRVPKMAKHIVKS